MMKYSKRFTEGFFKFPHILQSFFVVMAKASYKECIPVPELVYLILELYSHLMNKNLIQI
jgi:hypothetical protein